MDRDIELIEDSELCVKLDKGRVYHVKEIPDARTPIKHLEVEEVWQQVDSAGGQLLGKGSYGDVFKQECIQDVAGRKVGQLRAVKVVRKGAESTKAYYREELKAMAKFSMQKVSYQTCEYLTTRWLTPGIIPVPPLLCQVFRLV
jgi:hypothetical protein